MGSAEAQWTWNNHCGCGTKHYVAEKTLHVEVPMMSNGARVLANTGRTLLGFFTLGISEVAFGGFQVGKL
jgi:hypothetical protein